MRRHMGTRRPIAIMPSHDRTLTRAVMPVPKLIRPPTDATPAEAAAARGRPRALPDDFLREGSGRLGIMSLVAAGLGEAPVRLGIMPPGAAGLWVVATILGRLAMRSMQGDESMKLSLTMGDSI